MINPRSGFRVEMARSNASRFVAVVVLTTSRINLLKSATADKTACRPKVPHGGSVGRNSADGARGDDDVDAVDAVDVRASPSSSLTRGIVFRSSNQRTEVNDYDDDDDDDDDDDGASTDGRSNGRTRERAGNTTARRGARAEEESERDRRRLAVEPNYQGVNRHQMNSILYVASRYKCSRVCLRGTTTD